MKACTKRRSSPQYPECQATEVNFFQGSPLIQFQTTCYNHLLSLDAIFRWESIIRKEERERREREFFRFPEVGPRGSEFPWSPCCFMSLSLIDNSYGFTQARSQWIDRQNLDRSIYLSTRIQLGSDKWGELFNKQNKLKVYKSECFFWSVLGCT